LETADRYPDVDLILHLDERREEIEPLLLALIEGAVDDDWPDDDPRGNGRADFDRLTRTVTIG
jgi:hypothetical protein